MIRGAVLVALAVAFCQLAVDAAEPAPPMAAIGAPLPGEAERASLVRPSTFVAIFRVPRADTVLYVAARLYVHDLAVVVVGPGTERRTFIATDDLPGHMLGVQLPTDAWAADRLELRATTVSNLGAPYLLAAEDVAAIGWRTWSYDVLFGIFAAMASVFGALALIRRRLIGWYAAAMAGEAGLFISYLGVERPPPEISQPLNVVWQALVFAGLTGFALAYVRRAHLPRAVTLAAWLLVLVTVSLLAGLAVLQDFWPIGDGVEQALIGALMLFNVALGVVAIRRRIDGAWFFFAGTVAAAGGFGATFLPGALGTPLHDAANVGGALEALLLALAIVAPPRGDGARIGSRYDVDGLTGIANRAVLDARLGKSGVDRRNGGRIAAAVLLDVDRFRAYNDTYGHAAGDDALRRIAAVVAQSSGPGDLAGRYDDDRFLVLLGDADLTAAKRAGAELAGAIAALGIAHGAVPSKRLSVSVGVASIVVRDGDPMELIRRVTAALYLAKTMGRNRVVADEAAFPVTTAR
jgi:diguanylate cyclase (GGDEF)-like protein